MPANRSVPADSVLPHIAYREVADAAAWLTRVFGFQELYRYGGEPGGSPSGVQMRLGSACLMLEGANGHPGPAQLGFGTQYLTLFVDDPDAHFRHTQAQGALILEEPHDTVYGERQYAAQDLAGHRWLFSRHVRDLSPADWGAIMPGENC